MMVMLMSGGISAEAVSLPPNAFVSVGTPTVYSGLKIDADGNLYEYTPSGNWSRFATWLYIGTASDYYVTRTINYGTLNTDAGGGPLQLNTDREYSIFTNGGEQETQVYFEIASDVSGSPVVASRTYTILATTTV